MKIILRVLYIIVLLPFSLIYGLITGIRNTMFNIKLLPSEKFNTPIICIGNITVGGTGKTPHSEFIIKKLRDDFKVAYLSRGYKRKQKGFIIASDTSNAKEIGDEPMQIKQKFPNIIVAVDSNRRRAIHRLEKLNNPPDIIIMDDAFQHRYVKSDISILLTDLNRPFYNDHILPLGRLRETKFAKDRAQAIIVTKCNKDISPIEKRIIAKHINVRPYQNLFFTYMSYGDIRPVFEGVDTIDKKEQSYYSAFILTGIANPEPLYKKLDHVFREIIPLKYSDHYSFTVSDIKNINKKFKSLNVEKKCIITTEKDAMRLKSMIIPDEMKNRLYYIPIEPQFIDNNQEALITQIKEYVTKNKGMYRIH